MAKKTSLTKELTQIAIFLIIVGSGVYFLWIYPLNSVSKIAERPEAEQIELDSLPPNELTSFIEAGITNADSFRVQADGVTSLACVYFPPLDSNNATAGTVILLHQIGTDRTSLIPLGEQLNKAGYAVVLVDQRASGFSSGKFHGEGQLEANDLIETMSWLDLRTHLNHPVMVVGFGLGGEAALLATAEDSRIDRVMAINPFLTTERMQAIQKAEYDLLGIPFYDGLMWWWYNTSSGYAAPYREIEQIKPVQASTMLLLPPDQTDIPEAKRLAELSGDKLTIVPTPDTPEAVTEAVLNYLVPHTTE
jgi:pimeloyl-ACP methyl ester carboxylesterase